SSYHQLETGPSGNRRGYQSERYSRGLSRCLLDRHTLLADQRGCIPWKCCDHCGQRVCRLSGGFTDRCERPGPSCPGGSCCRPALLSCFGSPYSDYGRPEKQPHKLVFIRCCSPLLRYFEFTLSLVLECRNAGTGGRYRSAMGRLLICGKRRKSSL